METINARIRNKLSPVKNVIALIEAYGLATSGEQKKHILDKIIQSKGDLEYSLNELLKIE